MINLVEAFVLSFILSTASVGILEIVKSLIPVFSKTNTIVKSIISVVIELIIAVLGTIAFGKTNNIIYDIMVVVITIGFAQVGYETFVKFVKKLTELLKSKVTEKVSN